MLEWKARLKTQVYNIVSLKETKIQDINTNINARIHALCQSVR